MAKKDPSPTVMMKAPIEPNEYFFVADYDPEDENMFDNEMVGDPIPFTAEGIQTAMYRLEDAKASGSPYYNIYRRKFNKDRGDSEEEVIIDPVNYAMNMLGFKSKK